MADGGDPAILQLTPDEKRVYSQLFQQADTDKLGVVTGEVAVKFFEKTKLAPNVLGEIWQLSDTENRGLLTKAGFYVALRLIAHYQAGRDPSSELAFKPAPLPKFDGINLQPASPVVPSAPANALQPQASGIRIPPIIPEKVAQYSTLFEQSSPINGVLSGEQSKAIFERAGLPNEVLGRIWGLSDREQKGGLDITEFIIAMHLITSYKTRNMNAIPSALPPGLYEAAQRRGQPLARTGGPTAIPRQFTGPQRTSSPLARASATALQQVAQTTGPNWLVSPQEKAKFDAFFDNIDTARTGHLNGDQAVNFFNDSGLPEDTLAAIWDLADVHTEGHLNKEEFAVAMYLIRQQRSGAPLPAFLPAALVPPSMRSQPPPQAKQAPQPASAFDSSVSNTPQGPKSAVDDLFGLDSSPAKSSPAAAPAQVAQSTGSLAASRSPFDSDPFASSHDKPAPAAALQPAGTGSGLFRPFQPTSSFGASLAHQNTGGSVSSSQVPNRSLQQSAQFGQASANDDLLGSNDEEQSKKLTEDTTELANMSSQIGNLRTQMQDVQSKRSTNERDVSAAAAQKQELQQRLAQFRSQYEVEVQTVKSLEQQLTASRSETTKLQQEFAMLEGTRQDLQTQHAQVSQALETDRSENTALKSKISQLNAEISQLRPQIDKMRSEARQLKGMVAINKKQLMTNEGERDKLTSEASDMSKAAEVEQTRTMSPTPSIASPAASTRTNPFFRGAPAAGPSEPPQSPSNATTSGPSPSAFDTLFGPAAAGTSTPPQVSFSKAEGSTSSGLTASPQLRARSPALDAPPPPESRQFTPHMLPIYPVGGSKGGSITSSTRAAHPASAIDGVASTKPAVTGDSTQASAPSPFDTDETAQGELAKGKESEPQSAVEPSSALTLAEETIPGAFPNEASPKKTTQPADAAHPATDDFYAAFADLDNKPHHQVNDDDVFGAKGNKGKKPEDFYPMTEPAEDSSSDDDDTDAFADDFGTPKPATNGVQAAPVAAEQVESRPKLDSQPSTAPPAADAQTSPPAYAPRKNSRPGFPEEFDGLLPSRDDPTASPHLHSVPSHPQNAQTTGGSSSYFSSASDTFEDASSRPLSSVEHDAAQSTPTAPKQTVTSLDTTSTPTSAPKPHSSTFDFDDSFDDFADLSEARNATDEASAIDKFDFSDNASVAEFNPTFDSPAASMMTASQQTPIALNGAFHNNDAFGSSSASGPGGVRKDRAIEDVFASAPSRSASGAHDWDAIFSGLGSSSSDNGPSAADGLTAGGTTTTAGGPSAASGTATGAPTTRVGEILAGRPAQQERSMSNDSASDDPILRKLTGDLGYPRPQALAALEATGYDINAAIDRLTKAS